MKKALLTTTLAIFAATLACAQNMPSIPNSAELKKEIEKAKTDPNTVTKVTEVVKTNVNTTNTAKLLTLIKTKVPISASQESKILGIVSKIDLSKTSSSNDQLKRLLGTKDFTQIFSSTQLIKLKGLISKK